ATDEGAERDDRPAQGVWRRAGLPVVSRAAGPLAALYGGPAELRSGHAVMAITSPTVGDRGPRTTSLRPITIRMPPGADRRRHAGRRAGHDGREPDHPPPARERTRPGHTI